ncbi:MAG: hypothetical protein ABJB66_14675 [Gemmatimonadaceae bacterium]
MRSRFIQRISRRGLTGGRVDKSAGLVLAALVGGLVLGAVGWSLQQHRHRQALFHARPFRRLAALGYLRRHPSVDSARLLHDYLRWESHPLLRRRARLVLRRMERILRS